ncbi:MAG: hypothetical protein Q4E03_05600 [Trueperella sp.]|nr:hypothetical protein [Trueperella sp.]
MTFPHRSALALLATSLLLAGCSGGGDNGLSANSDFAFDGIAGPAESIHIEIPQELMDAMGPEADKLLVTAIDIKAHDLDSAKYCAVDLTYTFSDGAIETLSAPLNIDPRGTQEYTEKLDELTLSFAPGHTSGQVQDILSALYMEGGGKMPAGPEREIILRRHGFESFDVDGYLEERQRIREEVSADIKNADPAVNLLSRMGAKPISEFNETAPEPGKYMQEDASSATVVRPCALNSFDDDNSGRLKFFKASGDAAVTKDVATVKYTVMKDGKVTIISSEVKGYQQDSSGNWLEK